MSRAALHRIGASLAVSVETADVVTWSEDQVEAASFLAVVPPDPIAREIVELQRVVGVDTSVPPHVTVKSQPALAGVERWRPSVEAAVKDLTAFDVTLGGVGWFGTGIVFLQVSRSIVDLHRVVLEAVERVVDDERFEYDGDGYEPHLTLGAEFAGATAAQLSELARLFAGRRFSFTVKSVLEFRRTERSGLYRPVTEFLLG
jgi:2'-5' RNA ligase